MSIFLKGCAKYWG